MSALHRNTTRAGATNKRSGHSPAVANPANSQAIGLEPWGVAMTRILIAIGVSFVAASLADWLFMGVLFHERYKVFPEVWRDEGSETRRILIAQIYAAMTAVGFVALASTVHPHGIGGSLTLATLIWVIAPLPLLLGNHLFLKLDPLVTASHAAGWLVKLALIAGVTAAIL